MASRSVETGVLRILDGSHGLSDWYPPRLEENQLSEAWDVEFWDGTVCGRRNGSTQRVGAGAGLVGYSLYVWTPTTRRADDRLVMAYLDPAQADRNVVLYDAAWAPAVLISQPDVLDFSQGVDWASLHGKLFIATKSNANRLHVYSPSWAFIRPTGIAAQTAAPGVANVAGTPQTYFDPRQFRTRLTRQVNGITMLRSEPSPVASFTPVTNNSVGALVTVSGVYEPWVTHWELEELSGGEWYRTATINITVSTGIQTVLPLAQVAISGVLSEDIGDYTLQYSARFLTVDEDRLILGGSFDEEAKSARVSWTALGLGSGNGQVGVGNDERLPSDVNGFLDFDMLDGGGLTGIKAWEGKVIVFKRSQVHQMVRASSTVRAYLPDTLSRRHGAIPFSIVEGTDVDGLSCLYFLDPEVGPMQLGFKGLRVLAPNLQRTWRGDINLTTATAASVTYHAEKRQVWWHVAVGNSAFQNIRWMYSVESDGVVFHTTPAPIKSATAWLRKPTLLYDTSPTFVVLVGQGDQPDQVVDYYDNARYRAFVVTKAYQLGSLLRRFAVGAAVLEAGAAPGATVYIGTRRDFGAETRSVPVSLTPETPVDLIVVPVDNSYMTEAITMQFAIGDLVPLPQGSVGAWQIHGLTLAWDAGSPTTGRG